MKETIRLWEKDIPLFDPTLSPEIPAIDVYRAKSKKANGAVIVCPGGGYERRAEHEGEPIAQWLNSFGVTALVLTYRVKPYRHPCALLDAQRAIRTVRYNSQKWSIDPKKIGILGFSAGGHLTSSAGVHFDNGKGDATDPIDRISSRPDAMILCYAAILSGSFGHDGLVRTLYGENPTPEERAFFSSDLHITDNTPPAFLWHTANDNCVPVENSLLFSQAMSQKKVPFELHVFPRGSHGLGLAEDIPEVNTWTDLCRIWLENMGFAG
jgi:acetyl esterase/lipase